MYKILFSFLKISALRLASNSPLAILFQQFSFSNSFPFKKPPTKCQKPKSKSLKQKPQDKILGPSFNESFIPSGKQGGTEVLGKRHDIVTGKTCLPASLKINSLEAAVLRFPLLWPGLCLYLPTDNLRKNS
jgi:hypothetical protein